MQQRPILPARPIEPGANSSAGHRAVASVSEPREKSLSRKNVLDSGAVYEASTEGACAVGLGDGGGGEGAVVLASRILSAAMNAGLLVG